MDDEGTAVCDSSRALDGADTIKTGEDGISVVEASGTLDGSAVASTGVDGISVGEASGAVEGAAVAGTDKGGELDVDGLTRADDEGSSVGDTNRAVDDPGCAVKLAVAEGV